METEIEGLFAEISDDGTGAVHPQDIAGLMATIHELKKQLDKYRKVQTATIAGMKKVLIRGHSYNPNYSYRQNEVAAIRLTGRWLNELGFFPDDQLCVIPANGMLVIFPESVRETI